MAWFYSLGWQPSAFIETCDEENPHLITQVETRPTIEQDN